jgi:alcohol dehydrogenase, propanol-preferring
VKAYRLLTWKTAPEYCEVPQPDPGPGQVLVKVGAAGLCHSDLHVMNEFDAGVFNADLPFTLGHENAGWVEACGPGVSGLEIGEPVAVYGPLGCGRCARCQTGEENICDRLSELPGAGWGLGVDGGLAQYMLVDSVRQLAPLGDLAPHLAAPLTDAAVTPYRAIRRSLDVLTPGSTALVIGVGGLGHIAIQLLRAMCSSTIIAVDAKPRARALAAEMGAHHVVAAGDGAAAEINELTKGRGVDLALDLVGMDATLALAFAVTRSGCRVMLVGAAGGTVPFSLWSPRFEVQVSSSSWGSINDLRDVIAMAGRGQIVPKVATYAFDEIPHAFHLLETGELEGRAVILPNG